MEQVNILNTGANGVSFESGDYIRCEERAITRLIERAGV